MIREDISSATWIKANVSSPSCQIGGSVLSKITMNDIKIEIPVISSLWSFD
jgi:hypothetical protein